MLTKITRFFNRLINKSGDCHREEEDVCHKGRG